MRSVSRLGTKRPGRLQEFFAILRHNASLGWRGLPFEESYMIEQIQKGNRDFQPGGKHWPRKLNHRPGESP